MNVSISLLSKAPKSKQYGRHVNYTTMQASFFLNVKRANYIALIWKKSNVAKPVFPPVTDHGWNEYGSLTWIPKIFPKEAEEILLDEEFDSIDYIDDNRENEDKGDIWLSPALFSFTMYFLFKHTSFL